jgi:FAD/FMN-containing dehydrogenase
MTRILSEPRLQNMRRQTVRSRVGALQTESLIACPRDEAECREILRFCRHNRLSVCLRGGGYSYGDAILNDRNLILDTSRINRILEFDEIEGRITVQPGVRLIDIYKATLHRRYVLAATPSESTITVAGAIAANVNGKDGWRMGNFGDQVVGLRLMLASGEIVSANRDANPELFRAVIGGMGLLAIIVEATLRLQRIPSPLLEIRRTPVGNLAELLALLQRVKVESDFAVVWLDTCATGAKLGRSVVHATQWVDSDLGVDELRAQVLAGLTRLDARLRQARRLGPLTGFVVGAMMHMQRVAIRVFNKLYYSYCLLRQTLHTSGNIESVLRYIFDASFMIPSAAAVCGPHGYTVQLTIPESVAREAIGELIRLCQESPCLPAKLIMRLHRRDAFLLSFSEDGYSMNLELHPKSRHERRMDRFLDDLMASVIRNGGRVHLAKDHVLTRAQFQALFPEYRQFLELKHRFDPGELFQSDMYRRLIRDEAAAASDDPGIDERPLTAVPTASAS